MEVGPETAPPASVQEEGPEGVVNYTRIDATVACGGATPPETMAALKDLGFAAVINRVGAMWMIKRVKLDGWSVNDAMAEAEMIGLSSQSLKEFALEYVGNGV